VTHVRTVKHPLLHHPTYLDRERLVGAGEALGRRLDALDHRHRQHARAHVRIDVEHLLRAAQGLVVAGVGGVALLPEELRGAKEGARAELPALGRR
jgi:hypothetical protein